MASGEAENSSGSYDAPLKSIIETPLTDSLDGSFPATAELGNLFNVDFEKIKTDLTDRGLDKSISEAIYKLISTASVLFYFLYHSQKTKFPVDIEAIREFVSKARSELEGISSKDDPIVQTYIDKGELAVKYVISTREAYSNVCNQINLSEPNWESYTQHLMDLDKQLD